MSDTVLTSERILEAAEEVLRRFGPTKATVIDVARVLHVSHGSVYRHFASKAALRDAVIARWLARISTPLATTLSDHGPAPERLRHWFDQMRAAKLGLAKDDPELFAAYGQLVGESKDVLRAHVDNLVGQIAVIIADGVARGDFTASDPQVMARAVFDATVRFHKPVHAMEWGTSENEAAFDRVWTLILSGLEPRGNESRMSRSKR